MSLLRFERGQKHYSGSYNHASIEKPQHHVTVEALDKPPARSRGHERQSDVADQARHSLDLLIALEAPRAAGLVHEPEDACPHHFV